MVRTELPENLVLLVPLEREVILVQPDQMGTRESQATRDPLDPLESLVTKETVVPME